MNLLKLSGAVLSVAFVGTAWVGGVTPAEVPVRYRVTFDATWSAETHPVEFPGVPHFSPLIGGTHDSRAVFWYEGGLASEGVRRVAELGATSTFRNEILAEAAAGHAFNVPIQGPGIPVSPGAASVTINVTRTFPRVTLISMLACSPDWFVGTNGLELLRQDGWRDGFAYSLVAWDAGTDSGATYEAADQPTVPHVSIHRIDTSPLATDGFAPPVGTYTFEILDVDGLTPYGDQDMDGLDNVTEAAQGTDPRNRDSDQDSWEDPDDNCPLSANPSQMDSDGDGVGSVCDVCPDLSDPRQADADFDGEGDLCDLDDGRLRIIDVSISGLVWQIDANHTAYNLYRGDLPGLRDGAPLIQDPAVGIAAQFCELATPTGEDLFLPSPGEGVYYLVAGVFSDGVEGSLGVAPTGGPRFNEHPCP